MPELKINPWFSMWTHPRETIQAIIAYKPTHHLAFLSIVVGWPSAIQIAQMYFLSEIISLPLILLFTLLAAPILGIIGILITSAIVYLIGKALGSRSTFSHTTSAIAWSNVPALFTGATYVILIAYFQAGWFSSAWINMPVGHLMVYILFCLFLGQIIAFGWTIYLFIQSIAEVHGFSTGKATVNFILAAIVLIGVVQLLS